MLSPTLLIDYMNISLKLLEAISKIGFWFKFSRLIAAGQERGIEFQPADILKYFEELEFGPHTETCPPLVDWDKRPF